MYVVYLCVVALTSLPQQTSNISFLNCESKIQIKYDYILIALHVSRYLDFGGKYILSNTKYFLMTCSTEKMYVSLFYCRSHCCNKGA